MNKLDNLKKDRDFIMTHLIYGYPDIKTSLEIAKAMEKGGSSILEIQLPFSDPIADGPTIVGACQKALEKPKTVKGYIDFIRKISNSVSIPIVVMSYTNPMIKYGVNKFIKEISDAGASGVIIADLPLDSEEGKLMVASCRKYNIYPVTVLSPGVPIDRVKELSKYMMGFIYCTSRQGVTGADSHFDKNLSDFIKNIREIKNIPVAVGFGVKDKKDVKNLLKICDIVIAGSVFIKAIENTPSNKVYKKIKDTVKDLID